MTLYASTAQIKAALRITDSVDDSLLNMAGSAASELIDGFCGRTFGTASATRYYAADDAYLLQVDDLGGTAVTIQTSDFDPPQWEVTWTVTDYQLEPLNAYVDGLTYPYTRIRAIGDYLWPFDFGEVGVKITGPFGWPSIPSVITQAAVIQASRIFKRLDSPLGVAGFGDLGAIRISRQLDPDVAQLVSPYVRYKGYA